jgi:hypothetical protein
MGQMADLRAQLTPNCISFESSTGAAIFCRTKFVIESTVVKTKPSSCSAIAFAVSSFEFRVSSSSCLQTRNPKLATRNYFMPIPARPCAKRNSNQRSEFR